MYYLGIDTSCYTTSVAVIDEEEKLVLDKRIMLRVKSGDRGIRQSDAFYQHIENLDTEFKEVFKNIDAKKIKAIGVSSRPRNNPDSYMPVFNSGLHIANIMSLSMNIPLFVLSHQEDHILAGLWSQQFAPSKPFAAYHLSGGTTELLFVEGRKDMKIEIIGGSSDLKAGQFIDRVGVSMGLNFPCGKEMDMLSKSAAEEGYAIPSAVKGSYASFSGPETHVQRIIKEGNYDRASLSKAVFMCIAESIEETLINSKDINKWEEVLLIGGVSSNSTVFEYLTNSSRLKRHNIGLIFSQSRYCGDNALGGAVYAKKSIG